MWIYSLGITLRRTIHSFSGTNTGNQVKVTTTAATVATTTKTASAPLTKTTTSTIPSTFTRTDENDNEGGGNDNIRQQHKNFTSLEHVIRTMCAPNINYRASLMYLLDVSNTSKYFYYYHFKALFWLLCDIFLAFIRLLILIF